MAERQERINILYFGKYNYRDPRTAVLGIAFCTIGCLLLFFAVYVVLICGGVPPPWIGKQPVDLVGRILFALLGIPAGIVLIYVAKRLLQAFIKSSE